MLPGLLDGSAVAAWAGHLPVEAHRRRRPRSCSTGTIGAVEAAAEAAHLLVAARTAGWPHPGPRARRRAGAHGHPPRAGSTSCAATPRCTFAGVSLPATAVVGAVDEAIDEVERLLQIACVLQCAETCGAIDRVFAMTLEYLGDRYSFGRPLVVVPGAQAPAGRRQDVARGVPRHRHGRGPGGGRRGRQRRRAGQRGQGLDRSARHRAHAGRVQLHGGIGVTWEHDLHLYLRRATVNRATHGTPEWHSERVAQVLLGGAA